MVVARHVCVMHHTNKAASMVPKIVISLEICGSLAIPICCPLHATSMACFHGDVLALQNSNKDCKLHKQ